MLNTTFSPWPSYTEKEISKVSEVLTSNRVNYWTGTEGREFEMEYAQWTGCNHAVTVANGTLALDLALVSLGVGEGDEVIVTPRTFLASASSIVLSGATPVFADVDRDSQNITPETVAPLITDRTKAILCVHLAGWPCEMLEFQELVDSCAGKPALIEDCAQAHGARLHDKSVGGFGEIGAWSFCQDKIITSGGEGGMVTTNSEEHWKRMWAHKDHGKSWDKVYNQKHPPGFRWLHDEFGTNWRMSEVQSSIGRIQLSRMPEWQERRTQNAERIMNAARAMPGLRVPELPGHIKHAHYKCYVFVEPAALKEGWNRDRIMNEITMRGVPCFSGTCSEVYLEKAFENNNLAPAERLPVAQELGENSLMFLVHPTLQDDEISKTIDTLRSVMRSTQKSTHAQLQVA